MQRVNAHIQAGHARGTEELIEKALDAFDEKSPAPVPPMRGSLHEFFMNSPLRGANLDLERAHDRLRSFDLDDRRTKDAHHAASR